MSRFRAARSFAASEDGGMTGGGLIFMIVFLAVGGLAVDVSNAISQRTHLQLTADATAHSALYVRNYTLNATPEDAKTAALALGRTNMPPGVFGEVLSTQDIEFGVWNRANRTFTPDETSRTAVRVWTHRDAAGENEVTTYLLKFAGFDSFDVRTASVFETYVPDCLREGFVAEEMVDIQSNNSYVDGFCIHSNDIVSINNNNYFEEGTVVSMPDSTRLDMPPSGVRSNEGLTQALRYGAMQIRLINALREVPSSPYSSGIAAMWNYIQLATRDGQLGYLTAPPRNITIVNGQPSPSAASSDSVQAGRNLLDRNDALALRPNAVNYVFCSSTSTQLQIRQALTNVVMITNCQISFGSGGALENGLIATLHRGASSISGSSDTRIGAIDNCAAGGGAQLISLGGMNFASGVSIHGGQLIALREISFAANGDGVRGTSIISGDTVSGTSNMEMGLCGSGMEGNLSLDYFRMVQ
ncbi:TadE/TadG family type IV pilus assembly protein [Tabrizicola sp.]|uniref:TadE/TadG family type IV pilus assembly protein n=1 Tax=Tabrizicola sp. TaxID=2005166 RepID=UPI002734AB89|nr:Tad domain-containing protein [Tabrizicola sp.]MDP3194977.1 Tad domain-containing protein [Tabrizicola sp.]